MSLFCTPLNDPYPLMRQMKLEEYKAGSKIPEGAIIIAVVTEDVSTAPSKVICLVNLIERK